MNQALLILHTYMHLYMVRTSTNTINIMFNIVVQLPDRVSQGINRAHMVLVIRTVRVTRRH